MIALTLFALRCIGNDLLMTEGTVNLPEPIGRYLNSPSRPMEELMVVCGHFDLYVFRGAGSMSERHSDNTFPSDA
jgi:hypothetical protein